MSKTYQALFIFPASLKDDRISELMAIIKGEIERFKGAILNSELMGKRTFARRLKKLDAGYYAKVIFQAPPDAIAPLQSRFKLVEDIFRVQIVNLPAGSPRPAAQPAEAAAVSPQGEERQHGQS